MTNTTIKRCDQTTVRGDRCTRRATWRGLRDGEWYCTQHANHYGISSVRVRRGETLAHYTLRVELNLTTPGCDCSTCENMRDLGIISRSCFGDEDEAALAAIDRVNARA